MRISFQTSTGRLMLLVIVTAGQLTLFQDVWHILVIPPFTMMTLALNIGLWFLALRPQWLETRIIGMLLGGIAAAMASLAYALLGLRRAVAVASAGEFGPISVWLVAIAAKVGALFPDQEATPAILVQMLARGAITIEFVLLDLCGLALIWASGSLECRMRRHRQQRAAHRRVPFLPIDDRARTPL